MNNPKVSVIIPVYNGEQYIAQAIKSALSQTYNNVEVLVINDGSTDNTYTKIKPWLPSVKYVYQENKGLAAARNTGIRNSTGELIGFLDHDDLWLPEKLEIQVNYLLKHKDISLVHSKTEMKYEGNIERIPDPPLSKAIDKCFKELFFRNQIAGATVLLKKSCLDQIGLFDERMFFGEDYELWLRMSRFFLIGYIDRVLYLYRQHSSNMSTNFERALLGEIKVIETILIKFPEIYQELGDSVVKNRLYGLYHRMANFYSYLDKRESARQYYWKVLTIRPAKLDCWTNLLIWSFLTRKQRNNVRWYKQKLRKLLYREDISNEHQQD